MENKKCTSRRNFLKTTAAGGAGLIVSNGLLKTAFSKESASRRGIEINPNINNLRVVYIEDPTMLEDGTNTSFGSFSSSTSKIDAAKAKENMDKMACALANIEDINQAWGTIFQKPTAKDWEDVTVAIKPNCAASCNQSIPHASVPIMKTVIDVLVGFGVKGSNMTIYDVSGYSGNPSQLYPENLMVTGIKYAAPGSSTYTTTPYKATTVVRDVDIIINIASCKGHGTPSDGGKITLTMKNHIGTMKLNCPSTVKTLIDIHNSEAILGKPPFSAANPPKQQLAIIDCLWAAEGGPNNQPDSVPCIIVMGTLCPAVDCFTAIKVRTEKLNYHSASDRTGHLKYLTEYGYNATTDIEPLLVTPSPEPDAQGRAWLDANDWTPTGIHPNTSNSSKNSIVKFSVIGAHFKPITQNILLKQGEKIESISIVNMKGRVIRSLSLPSNNETLLTWDARNDKGRTVSAGTYILKIAGTKTEKAVKFNLNK